MLPLSSEQRPFFLIEDNFISNVYHYCLSWMIHPTYRFSRLSPVEGRERGRAREGPECGHGIKEE